MSGVAKTALKEAKTTVKRTKNALKVHVSEIAAPTDRERVRTIAHLLLEQIESLVKQRSLRTPAAEEVRIKKHAAIFGDRDSCVDNLVALSELLLKLEKPQSTEILGQLPTSEELKMKDADLALVEHFVDRVRGRENA